MKIKISAIKFSYLLLMMLIFLIYPWWLVIENFKIRLLIFIVFFFFCLGMYLIFGRLLQELKGKNDNFFVFKRGVNKKIFYFLVLLFVFLLCLHAYSMTFPSEIIGDEHFHISKGLFLFFALKVVLSKLVSSYGLLLFPVIISLALLVYFKPKIKLYLWCKEILANKRKNILFFSLLFLIFLAYFFMVNHFVSVVHSAQFGDLAVKQSHFAWLVRFPPIGTILSSFTYLFGYNIFVVRLLQTIFYFFSGIVLYKLVLLFRSKTIAFFASAFFLLSPGYFKYGHMAYMEPGLIFFILLSSYFFLKYLKSNNSLMGIISSLFIFIGFYYKGPIIFLFPIFWMVLLFSDFFPKHNRNLKYFFHKHRLFFYSNLIALTSILPWIFIAKEYNLIQYSSYWSPQSLFSMKGLLFYSHALYNHLTPLLFILSLVLIAYSIWKQNDLLTKFCISFTIIWYLIFTSYFLHPRLIIPVIPFVMVLSSQALSEILYKVFRKKYFFVFMGFVLLIYLLFSSIWSTYRNINNNYPLDEAYSYMANNLPTNKTVYLMRGLYNDFYLNKYNLKNPLVKNKNLLRENPDLIRFHKALLDNNIDYILFISSADIFPEHFDMIKEININSSLFLKIKQFNMGNNTITLSKVIH